MRARDYMLQVRSQGLIVWSQYWPRARKSCSGGDRLNDYDDDHPNNTTTTLTQHQLYSNNNITTTREPMITARGHSSDELAYRHCHTSSEQRRSDAADLRNYRPISYLTFISKLGERLVCRQLVTYVLPNLHSAYRRCHSTEIAVLKLVPDLLTAPDRGQVTFLNLLDLYATFDTVDHDILMDR